MAEGQETAGLIRCPECNSPDVSFPGGGRVTLVGWAPFQDARGLHKHDPNVTISSCRCRVYLTTLQLVA